MIMNQLTGHERRVLDHRMGVPTQTLKMLQRAAGLDLLMPEEQVFIQEKEKSIKLEDGSYPIVFHVYTKLFYPVPGYRELIRAD